MYRVGSKSVKDRETTLGPTSNEKLTRFKDTNNNSRRCLVLFKQKKNQLMPLYVYIRTFTALMSRKKTPWRMESYKLIWDDSFSVCNENNEFAFILPLPSPDIRKTATFHNSWILMNKQFKQDNDMNPKKPHDKLSLSIASSE